MGTMISFRPPVDGQLLAITSQRNCGGYVKVELYSEGTLMSIDFPHGCEAAKAARVVEALSDCYGLPVVFEVSYEDMRCIKMMKERV